MSTLFFEALSLFDLVLTQWARLADQQDPEFFFPLSSQLWDYQCMPPYSDFRVITVKKNMLYLLHNVSLLLTELIG